MFITPYFGGCKYTNNFLFINKNIVFQHFVLLITHPPVSFSSILRPHSVDQYVLEIVRFDYIFIIRPLSLVVANNRRRHIYGQIR